MKRKLVFCYGLIRQKKMNFQVLTEMADIFMHINNIVYSYISIYFQVSELEREKSANCVTIFHVHNEMAPVSR